TRGHVHEARALEGRLHLHGEGAEGLLLVVARRTEPSVLPLPPAEDPLVVSEGAAVAPAGDDLDDEALDPGEPRLRRIRVLAVAQPAQAGVAPAEDLRRRRQAAGVRRAEGEGGETDRAQRLRSGFEPVLRDAAELHAVVAAPAPRDPVRVDPAGEAVPGRDGDEIRGDAHGGEPVPRRGGAVAELAVGVLADAVGGPVLAD